MSRIAHIVCRIAYNVCLSWSADLGRCLLAVRSPAGELVDILTYFQKKSTKKMKKSYLFFDFLPKCYIIHITLLVGCFQKGV